MVYEDFYIKNYYYVPLIIFLFINIIKYYKLYKIIKLLKLQILAESEEGRPCGPGSGMSLRLH